MAPTAKKAAGRTRTAKPKTFAEKREQIIADRKVTTRFEWEVYGRIWHLKRPNVALLGELEERDDIAGFTLYLTAHIDAAEREDFMQALAADEELDFDIITAMAEDMQSIVYSEIPTKPSASS